MGDQCSSCMIFILFVSSRTRDEKLANTSCYFSNRFLTLPSLCIINITITFHNNVIMMRLVSAVIPMTESNAILRFFATFVLHGMFWFTHIVLFWAVPIGKSVLYSDYAFIYLILSFLFSLALCAIYAEAQCFMAPKLRNTAWFHVFVAFVTHVVALFLVLASALSEWPVRLAVQVFSLISLVGTATFVAVIVESVWAVQEERRFDRHMRHD